MLLVHFHLGRARKSCFRPGSLPGLGKHLDDEAIFLIPSSSVIPLPPLFPCFSLPHFRSSSLSTSLLLTHPVGQALCQDLDSVSSISHNLTPLFKISAFLSDGRKSPLLQDTYHLWGPTHVLWSHSWSAPEESAPCAHERMRCQQRSAVGSQRKGPGILNLLKTPFAFCPHSPFKKERKGFKFNLDLHKRLA